MLLFHWILTHLHHAIALAGAAGIGLPELGDSAPVISDSGEGSGEGGSEGSGEDQGDEGTEGTEGQEGQGDGQAEGDQGGKPAAKAPEEKVDWRTVPEGVKNHLKELAKTDTKLANLLQNAVYTSQTMLKEFPGGLKEVKALKTTLEDLGGLDEIKGLKELHSNVLEEQESLDNMAREGNPEVLNNLIEVAGNDGFGKLMPVALDRWATTDPQMYNHVMSRVIVGALREGAVVAELNTAFKMLALNNEAATKEAMESLKKVAEWANSINRTAQTVPEKPKVDPQIEQQQRELDSRRTKLFNEEFSSSFGAWRNKQILDQVKAIAGNRNLTEYQMSTLGERVVNDVANLLKADIDYMKNLRKVYDSRNMDELQKFTRSRTMKILPEAVRRAYRALFSNPSAPKKQVAKQPAAQPAQNGNGQQPTVKGWTKIDASKAPKPDQIDNNATDFKMKFNRQAILKNGQKVYWGTHVPQE